MQYPHWIAPDFDESLLQRMQTIGLLPALFGMFAQGFDGGDVVTFRLRREQRPRVDRFAIQQNSIRA